MKNIFLSTMLLFAFPMLMMCQTAEKPKGQINWVSIEELDAKMAEEPRPVFIDVYTNWCGWCKKMDKDTFQNEKIAAYVNENFYGVKFNAERKDSITFQGRNYKFVQQGRRGYHELAAALLQGKMSYPNIVYLDKNGQYIAPVPGYRNAQDFEKFLKYFAGGHHTETPFEEWQKTFESEL